MTLSISGGNRGPQGLSAYAVAVENGFVGTAAQWLASITPFFIGPVTDLGSVADPVVQTMDMGSLS